MHEQSPALRRRIFASQPDQADRNTIGRVHRLYEDLRRVLTHPQTRENLSRLVADARTNKGMGRSAEIPDEICANLEALMRYFSRTWEHNKHREELTKGFEAVDDPHLAALGSWNVECWISPDGQMGPLARLVVLARVLFPNEDTNKAVLSELSQYAADVDVSAQGFLDMFNWKDPSSRNADHYLVPWPNHRVLALALNARAFRQRLPALTYTQIMEVDLGVVTGPESLDAFETWIRSGVSYPTDGLEALHWSSPVSYAMYSSAPAVRSLADKVVELTVSAAPARPIIQLVSKDRSSAMKTVATMAASSVMIGHRAQGWRVIWLCATRSTDPSFRNTLREFLAPLARAFAIPLGDASAPLTSDQLARLVEAIRRGLTSSRCLVIAEGLQCAAGRGAALLSYLSGVSEREDLIRSLCAPHLEEAVSLEGASVCASKFLVMATQTSESLSCLTSATLALSEEALPTTGWQRFVPSDVAGRRKLARHLKETGEWLQQKLGCTTDGGDSVSYAIETGFIDVPDSVRRRIGCLIRFPTDAELAMMVLHSDTGAGGDKDETGSMELDEWMWMLLEHLRQRSPADLCVLALVACVPDGIFLGSLRRIFRHWRALVVFNHPASADLLGHVEEVISSMGADYSEKHPFFRRFRSILSLDLEQTAEHLGPRQLRWEVDDIHADLRPDHTAEDARYGAFKRRCSFTSPWIRQHFIRLYRRLDPTTAKMSSPHGVQAWWLMQFCAAGECQRQGTALLRNAEAGELAVLSRYRRFVQCIHHVVAAGPMPGVALPVASNDSNDHQLLLFPGHAGRREAFAYALMYRKLLEQEARWRLSRSWGRSELRVAMLTQFLYGGQDILAIPSPEPTSLLELPVVAPLRNLVVYGADGRPVAVDGQQPDGRVALPREVRRNLYATMSRRLTYREGLTNRAKMHREFMANLAHAAIDAEDQEIAAFAVRQIRQANKRIPPPGSAQLEAAGVRIGIYEIRIQAEERPRRAVDVDWETAKLGFDLLDMRGDKLVHAEQLCLSVLAQDPLNLEHQFHELVKSVSAEVVANITSDSAFDFAIADRRLVAVFNAAVDGKNRAQDRLALADFLGRLSDIRAKQADALADASAQLRRGAASEGKARDREDVLNEIAAFLPSWVLYWVADAVRASVGEVDDRHGTIWGNVSSRFYQTGIRTTLKLARLHARLLRTIASDSLGARGLPPLTRWLLNFAQSRADILVRDVHIHSRERFQSILLQSSLARTLAAIRADLRAGKSAPRDALEYVASAERKLLALGSPTVLARRWQVERIHVLLRWLSDHLASGEQDRDRMRRLSRIVQHDLAVLEGLAHPHPFWRGQLESHRRRHETLQAMYPGQLGAAR